MIPYVLDTGTVRLRPLRPEDAAVCGLPDLPSRIASADLHPVRDRVPYTLAVCPTGADDAVGYVGIVPVSGADAFLPAAGFAPELYIAPAFRGRGFGTASLRAFVRWLPQGFGILRLDAPADGFSPFLRRAGFAPSPEGLSADCGFVPPPDIPLSDGTVTLARTRLDPPDVRRGWAAAAFFDIRAGDVTAGACSLRMGYSEALFWNGHISYTVFPAHRGHGHAAAAARLLLTLARACGMPQVSVCCLPANAASRRTAENAGFALEGTFPIPARHPLYAAGRREEVRRYASLLSFPADVQVS